MVRLSPGARGSPMSSVSDRPACMSVRGASYCGRSNKRARGSLHRFDREANTSRRFRARCSCSRTHTTYASQWALALRQLGVGKHRVLPHRWHRFGVDLVR